MQLPPILARREISSNRFLSYVEEDLPDRHGKPYTYYQVESKWDAVIAVPILPDGRLVVERIYRHPYRHWFTEFPAGGIDPCESPVQAAIRELQEETGYRAGSARLLGTQEALPGVLRLTVHVVLCEDLVEIGGTSHEEMEMIQVQRMTRDECWTVAKEQPASSCLTLGLLWLGQA